MAAGSVAETAAVSDTSPVPSLFAEAHPYVQCATFSHQIGTSVAASDMSTASVTRGADSVFAAETRPACYELFGEGSFEPLPGGAPVFLGRVEQLRVLLRLADPSPQPTAGTGFGFGLTVHKCGPFFVLDGDPHPAVSGPPVIHGLHIMGDSELNLGSAPQDLLHTNSPEEGSPQHRDVEHPLPLVPFMSLEEILFGERRNSVSSITDAEPPQIGNEDASAHEPTSKMEEHLPVPHQPPTALSPLADCGTWQPTRLSPMRVMVKNTFLDVDLCSSDDSDFDARSPHRSHSAPAALGRHEISDAQPSPTAGLPPQWRSNCANGDGVLAPSWAIMPWREAQSLPWDLRQLLRITDTPPRTPPQTSPRTTPTMANPPPPCHMPPSQFSCPAAVTMPQTLVTQASTAQSPPLSQFSGAIQWSFGEVLLLVGCEMLAFRGASEGNSDSAPLRWRLGCLPGAIGHLDAWLAETLEGALERTSLAEGAHLLPLRGRVAEREGGFDPKPLMEQGRRLLCFLGNHCRREGGTYLLFRETSESGASGECKLFDLTQPDDAMLPSGLGALALCRKREMGPSTLALPLAHLCFRLAGQRKGEDRCRMLQKTLCLLESTRWLPKHRLLYTSAAVSLAVLRMAEHPDAEAGEKLAKGGGTRDSCGTARSAVALWYLEECIRLLGPSLVTDSSDMASDDDEKLKLETATTEEKKVASTVELLPQVYMYYATVIVKLVRDISALVSKMNLCVKDRVTFAVVQLVWLCRAQLSLDRMFSLKQVDSPGQPSPVQLLEHERLELFGDVFQVLASVEVADVPWPPQVACDSFAHILRTSVPGINEAASAVGAADCRSALLLSQLHALQRDALDDELSAHSFLAEAVAGVAAARRAWDFYAQAVGLEGQDDCKVQRAVRTEHLRVKHAKVGRSMAADLLVGDRPHEADQLLQRSYDLAVEAGDDIMQHIVLLDAAELRAKHAETLSTLLPGLDVFAFAVAQYAEYCRALELCRIAGGVCRSSSSCISKSSQRLAALEMKVGVHLLQYAEVQDNLIYVPVPVDHLSSDAQVYGGALAGVGVTSTAWLKRAKSTPVVELALGHLQRALRLFEGNGDETAAVHFQLAEAYALQLRRPPPRVSPASSAETVSARRAAALRHAERAATSFEAGQYWHDAAVAQRRRAELHSFSDGVSAGRGVAGSTSIAEAFRILMEAEVRLSAASKTVGAEDNEMSSAARELRSGMGDLVRVLLQRAGTGNVAAETWTATVRELYRQILRGESLRSDAAHSLMIPSVASSDATMGKRSRTKRNK